MIAIIPAAGKGTRMEAVTGGKPKELLPLGSKAVLLRVLEEARASDPDEIVVVTRPGDEDPLGEGVSPNDEGGLAGAPMPVKFTASRQSGAGKATIRELRAYASFDDGANWVPVKSIVPPGGAPGGYVSLRVVAEDTDGNTVDQTVLRAYRLRA